MKNKSHDVMFLAGFADGDDCYEHWFDYSVDATRFYKNGVLIYVVDSEGHLIDELSKKHIGRWGLNSKSNWCLHDPEAAPKDPGVDWGSTDLLRCEFEWFKYTVRNGFCSRQ